MVSLRTLHKAVQSGERVLWSIDHIQTMLADALEGLAKMEQDIEDIRRQLSDSPEGEGEQEEQG